MSVRDNLGADNVGNDNLVSRGPSGTEVGLSSTDLRLNLLVGMIGVERMQLLLLSTSSVTSMWDRLVLDLFSVTTSLKPPVSWMKRLSQATSSMSEEGLLGSESCLNMM